MRRGGNGTSGGVEINRTHQTDRHHHPCPRYIIVEDVDDQRTVSRHQLQCLLLHGELRWPRHAPARCVGHQDDHIHRVLQECQFHIGPVPRTTTRLRSRSCHTPCAQHFHSERVAIFADVCEPHVDLAQPTGVVQIQHVPSDQIRGPSGRRPAQLLRLPTRLLAAAGHELRRDRGSRVLPPDRHPLDAGVLRVQRAGSGTVQPRPPGQPLPGRRRLCQRWSVDGRQSDRCLRPRTVEDRLV